MNFRLRFPGNFTLGFFFCLYLCLSLVQFVFALAPARAAEEDSQNKPVRDKWAIIVGISKFQNNKVPALKYAAKDARDFRNFLVNQAHFAPDHVRLLLDEKATQRRVLSELGNKFMARVAKPDDLVVLYFSTHGSPSQADIRGENFVVAYDSDPDDLYTTGIEMDKILESVDARVLSKRVLLVLDACHSGVVSPGAKGLLRAKNFDAEKLPLGSGQLVITSSAPDQLSWESKRYENGIFTRKLLEGLRSRGEKTTLKDAFKFLQDAVLAEAQEDYAEKQTPLLKAKWQGDELVLAVGPSQAQALPASVKAILESDSTVAEKAKPSDKANSGRYKYDRALAMFNKGDYASCIEQLSKAVAEKGGSTADAHYTLANAFVKVNKIPEAVKHYRESFKLNSNGKRADYCLQMINYYSRVKDPTNASANSNANKDSTRLTGAVSRSGMSPGGYTAGAATNAQGALPSGGVGVGAGAYPTQSGARSVAQTAPADVLEQMEKLRSALPKINPGKKGDPPLSQIMTWALQERANYLSEASARVDAAQRQLQDGESLVKKASSLAYSLVPSSRHYGESDEDFKQRKTFGDSLSKELLVPYNSELEKRNRILADETAVFAACESASRELSQSTNFYPKNNYYKPGSTNNSNCK